MSYPYAKVTVIVETDEGDTTTYVIPRAREIETNEWAEPVNTEIHKPWTYLENTINFGLSLKADFDKQDGYVLRRTVGKPVEENE